MSRLVLVTGGSRSGKSSYAQKLAESLPGQRVYVATCPVIDSEMQDRVQKHQRDRIGRSWSTIEEPVDLAGVLSGPAKAFDVVLVDCLTLWINNLLYEAEKKNSSVSESEIAQQSDHVLSAARHHGGSVIFVTNEVGMSIVPENALARRFRDLAGRTNQVIAAGCDELTLVVCGHPLHVKPTPALK